MIRLSIVIILVVGTSVATAVGVFVGLQIRPDFLGLPPVRVAPSKADPPVRPSASTVTALGRIEPETEVIGVSAPPGSRIQILHVKEGQKVEAGGLLVTLDNHDEMEASRNHARQLHEEATHRFEAESAHARTGIEAARCELKEVIEVSQKGIEAEEAQVRRTEAELEKAKRDLTRSTRLIADRAIPQSAFDTTELTVHQLEEQLLQHRATVSQLVRSRAVKTTLAEARVKQSETELIRIQKSIPVDSLKMALLLAEARLERTLVRAPFAGEILKVLTHAGETVDTRPILKMGDTSRMFVTAEVYETDAHRVVPGQAVKVTSKAFPEKQALTGTVETISALVFKKDVLSIDPAADADARVLETRIRLADGPLAARFNHLQVDVTIEVGN